MRCSSTVAVIAASLTACAGILPDIRLSDDPALQRRVWRIGTHLARTAERVLSTPPREWQFGAVERERDGAAAHHNGAVAVDAVLARKLPDDELAALLSHEIAHVIRAHSTEHGMCLATGCGLAATASVIGFVFLPWWGGLLVLGGSATGERLAEAAFGRELEEDADAVALTIVTAAGYPAHAVVHLLERFRERTAPTTPFSNHPSIDDRITRVRSIIAAHEHR